MLKAGRVGSTCTLIQWISRLYLFSLCPPLKLLWGPISHLELLPLWKLYAVHAVFHNICLAHMHFLCYPATPTELSRHKSSNISQTRVCYTYPDPWNMFLCLWPQVRKTQTHIWAPDTTRRHPAMNIHAQSQLNITHLITSLPWNCFSGFIAFCVSWCASMHHMHVLLDYVMQHLHVQNKIQIFTFLKQKCRNGV